MAFSIKTNRSKQFSFKIKPLSSGINISLSLPGITISFTIKGKSKIIKSSSSLTKPLGQVEYINNTPMVFDYPKEYHPMIKKIRRITTFNTISNWLIPLLIIAIISLFTNKAPILLTIICGIMGIMGSFIKIYVHSIGRIKLDYNDSTNATATNLQLWSNLSQVKQLWQVTSIIHVKDEKSNAGYPVQYNRIPIAAKYKQPFYLNTNALVIQIPLEKEKIIILPDLYLIISKRKLGIIKSSDVKITTDTVQYPEKDTLPEDANVLEYTFRYVNQDGTPDKRYKDNDKLPICQYGAITLSSERGLNLLIHTSKVNFNK